MTLQEFYTVIRGNYDAAIQRLLKEERIVKYLRKFAENGDYDNLLAALQEKRYEDAFRFSHNLKGMSLNLELTELCRTSDALCNLFRDGKTTDDYQNELDAVTVEYKKIVDAVKELD